MRKVEDESRVKQWSTKVERNRVIEWSNKIGSEEKNGESESEKRS